MTLLMHVSDLHFGAPFRPHVAAALLRTAADLSPDILVASGDFTQEASREEFAQARAFLQSLRETAVRSPEDPDAAAAELPVVVTPGNHDVPALPRWTQFFSPFRRYKEYIRPELDFELDHAGAVVVSLNSTSPLGSWLNGWLSRGQLDYCTRVFADVPEDKLRVVVAHHHLAPAPNLGSRSVMHMARRAIEHLTELKVDLILGGHKHRSYIGNSLDFYPGKDRDHGIIIVQCGTTTSRRGRAREVEKNTFNLIRTDGHTVHITQYMYFHEVDGFEVTAEHTYARASAKYIGGGREIQSLS